MNDLSRMHLLELANCRLDAGRRPLRLRLDCAAAARPEALLPQCVLGSEAMCGSLEFQILCVSESATLSLKDFIGAPCELQVVTDRGGLRRICGIVTAAATGQSDGGLATYKLTMRDALSLLEHQVNTRVFIDKTELEIAELIVAQWKRNNPVLASTFDLQIDAGLLRRPLPKRAFTMQHDESDAAFVRRLLQRRGIAWFFRAGLLPSPYASPSAAPPVGHTLVLFQDATCLDRNAAGAIRFHRDGATEERDAITAWSAERTLVPGQVSLFSWDYRNPAAPPFMNASATSQADQGATGNRLARGLEEYRVAAPHLGADLADLQTLGDLRMARQEYAAKQFHGEGGVRDLAVGEWFDFSGHPEVDKHPAAQRQFIVTSQRIAATSNLPAELGSRVERLFASSGWDAGAQTFGAGASALRYRTTFTCVRRQVRIVPPEPRLPPVPLQSAIVVGPQNEVVWCDAMGRVKIRFPATRAHDHAHASGAGSARNDSDSAWVRVASGWAGNGLGSASQCGARLLPPVGTEVLVAFSGGDPDKPVIVAQVYNGAAPPPQFRDEADLPNTRYQSGLRSREVRGHRGNQLRLDDTTGQISAQLASDHADTELNLGYLTEARLKAEAAPRGEGAELRTEGAVALHAARGILLSAWKLLGSASSKGSQLARDDYLALLRECGELCGSLGTYSAEHNGMTVDAAEQQALLARFAQWEDGSNTRPNAATPGEPVIGMTSPAGIGFASSKAIVSYAASNLESTSQRHLQLTAGQRFTLNAGKGVSLFAHHGGLHAIAHQGKLLMQSQHDDTAIDSARNMQLTATEGTATISAKVILLVAADGSFLKLGDGPPVLGSKAPLKFHAPDFTFDGPQSMAAQFPDFAAGGVDQRLELRYPSGVGIEDGASAMGGLVEDLKMKIALSDGSSVEGRSDSNGKSELLARDAMQIADITLLRSGKQ